MEKGWQFLKKLKIELPCDPTIPHLGAYLKGIKSQRDISISMITAAIFVIAKTWKQPNWPSIDTWIKEM